MIAVIGGGSFATALVKLLSEVHEVYWWMRNAEQAQHIQTHQQNPKYLSDVNFSEKVRATHLWQDLEGCKTWILAVPAAFLRETLPPTLSKNVHYVSGIKGLVRPQFQTVSQFLHQEHQISLENIAVISGPTHAEEIAQHQLSYLTIATTNPNFAKELTLILQKPYLQTPISTDVLGIEYAGILKNIMAIGIGVLNGLGYGDNFKAVYTTWAIREIQQLLETFCPNSHRNVLDSVYLGDMLVTCYSQFSRNRMFGNMLGKGYSVQSAQLEMNMVAEGYYALKSIAEQLQEKLPLFPITNMLYHIIYGHQPVKTCVKNAIQVLSY